LSSCAVAIGVDLEILIWLLIRVRVGYFELVPGVLVTPPVPLMWSFIVLRSCEAPRPSARGLC
jgi:hypothetical protein